MTTKAYATGAVIDYVNSGSAISSGDTVVSNGFVGVALTDIAATTGTGAVAVQGVFKVTKTAGQTWAIGERLYYVSGTLAFSTASSGNTFAGFAFVAAGNADTTGYIMLHPQNLDLSISGSLTLAGNFTTVGAFAMTLTATAATTVTLPTSGTLARISGESFAAIAALACRDTSAAFDVTMAFTSNPILDAARTITWDVSNTAHSIGLAASANIDLGGSLTTAAAFTTAGAFAMTLTATAGTNVTLPTTGTLVASGAIVNADVNASAAIATSKLAGGTHTTEAAALLPKLAYAHWDYTDQPTSGAHACWGATNLPDNAIIMGGMIEVLSTIEGDGDDSSTIAVHVNGANDLQTAAAISGAPWSSTGLKAIVPVMTAASSIKLTAARDITVTTAINATDTTLTQGSIDIWLIYVEGQ